MPNPPRSRIAFSPATSNATTLTYYDDDAVSDTTTVVAGDSDREPGWTVSTTIQELFGNPIDMSLPASIVGPALGLPLTESHFKDLSSPAFDPDPERLRHIRLTFPFPFEHLTVDLRPSAHARYITNGDIAVAIRQALRKPLAVSSLPGASNEGLQQARRARCERVRQSLESSTTVPIPAHQARVLEEERTSALVCDLLQGRVMWAGLMAAKGADDKWEVLLQSA